MTHQHGPAALDSLDFERAKEGTGTTPTPEVFVNEELLDKATKGPRLRVGHGEHHNTHNLTTLGAGPRLRLVEQDEDQTLAIVDLGNALLPPGEKLLVGQGWQKRGDCAVVGDAGGMDGGEVGDEVAMLGRGKESHGSRVGHDEAFGEKRDREVN